MFKQKYLGFLLIGLLLGIGLFGFIAYSIKNDTNITSTPAPIDKSRYEVTVAKDVVPTNQKTGSSTFLKDNPVNGDEQILKTQQEINYANLIEHRRQQDAINDQKEKIAKERWAEFVKTQPHELSALVFDMKNDAANQAGEAYTDKSYYLKHFEGERGRWGNAATVSLENYFVSHVGKLATILRIDCRSSMCEIAGQLHNIQVDPNNYAQAKNQLVNRWNDISSSMPNSRELSDLFILNGSRPLNYALPDEFGVFSVPFSIFIYGNYKSELARISY